MYGNIFRQDKNPSIRGLVVRMFCQHSVANNCEMLYFDIQEMWLISPRKSFYKLGFSICFHCSAQLKYNHTELLRPSL